MIIAPRDFAASVQIFVMTARMKAAARLSKLNFRLLPFEAMSLLMKTTAVLKRAMLVIAALLGFKSGLAIIKPALHLAVAIRCSRKPSPLAFSPTSMSATSTSMGTERSRTKMEPSWRA